MSSSTGKTIFRAIKSISFKPGASKLIKTEIKKDVENYIENAQSIVDNGYVRPNENLKGWKVWNNTRQLLGKVKRTIEGY